LSNGNYFQVDYFLISTKHRKMLKTFFIKHFTTKQTEHKLKN